MPQKKAKTNLVKVDFGKNAVEPEYDFSFIVGEKDWCLTKNYGLSVGQRLGFKCIDEFFDGDYIAIEVGGGYYHGFGYYLTNSILLGQAVYHPVPRKKIIRLGMLISPALVENYK